ncbi:hypothetical protein, partial [Nocardioides sp.]|uniref:hypothetical protein n=1 Tax=Nocardioides sp. TaxID=35761 RepID=UPI003219A828
MKHAAVGRIRCGSPPVVLPGLVMVVAHCIKVFDESRGVCRPGAGSALEGDAMLHPSSTSPAEVIGGADAQVAPLGERLWAA